MEHLEEIKINDIWQNNVNLLIGSGASFGLFPTLATNMKNESIETLGKHFEDKNKYQLKSLLFMYYYVNCIEPVISFDIEYTKLGADLKYHLSLVKPKLRSAKQKVNLIYLR
jgi:hypothetical protein